MNKRVVIVSPLEHLSEVLWISTVPAPRLGAIAIKGALDKIKLDQNLVDEVYIMCSGWRRTSPARQAALLQVYQYRCLYNNK
jgi:acetyl-CoA C-acetyltransferase